MKPSDRAILLGLLILGVGASFWFFALAPKRERASELEQTASQLRSEVSAQRNLVASARLAQGAYEKNYSSLVVLGKAAPADGDTPALLEQLLQLSDKAGTSFDLLELGTAAVEAPTPPPAPAPTDQSQSSEPPGGGETPAATPVSAAPPTEAAASTLPLGATVGPAGLGVLPYELTFSGDFFQIADLLESVDELVGSGGAKVEVGGRLLTVNGFTMTKLLPGEALDVKLSISSFVLPESQGLTAGGTSTMPPASVPASLPVSTEATP